ncbi:MAG: metallophosphoesterase family protein [Solirubrobacterales bacterium]
MRIAIISDTHMPRGARRLPDRCVEEIERSELLVHAGDLMETSVLSELEALGPPVVAIHGNVDEPGVCGLLPATRQITLEGAELAMIHDPGPAAQRLERLRVQFPTADAVVFGHTHMPEHQQADGFQIFNPGSPTEKRRAPSHCMGVLEASAGAFRFGHIPL